MKTLILFLFILQVDFAFAQSAIPVAGPSVDPDTTGRGRPVSQTLYSDVKPLQEVDPSSIDAVTNIINRTPAAANCSTVTETNYNFDFFEDSETCKVEPMEFGNFNLLLPYLTSFPSDRTSFLGPVSPLAPLPPQESTRVLNDAEKCNCLKDNEGAKVSRENILAEEKKAKELIRKAVNQKLLVDYTRHFEDVRYYGTNLGRMFLGDPSAKYACSQAEGFKSKVKDHAGCASLTDKQINDKLNDVLESFPNKSLKGDFSLNLSRIQRQIFADSLDRNPDNYNARAEHDRMLFNSNRENPDFKIFDKVMMIVIQDQSLNSSVMVKVLDHDNPLKALLDTFREKSVLMNEADKKAYLKANLGDELFSSLEKNIPQDAPGDFLAGLSITLGKASRLHPGIGRYLTDASLFRDASDKMVSTPEEGEPTYTSMMTLLESNKLMKDHFESSCNDLKDKFANTICANDEELFSNMGPTELSQLLKDEKDSSKNGPLSRSLFICEKVISNPSLISRLLFNPVTDRPSKYYALVNNQRDEADVAIDHAIKDPESEAGQALAHANQTHGNTAFSDPNDEVARIVLGKDMKPSSMLSSNSSSSESEIKNVKFEKNDQPDSDASSTFPISSETPEQGIAKVNYANSESGNSSLMNNYAATDTKIESPKEMREFLADESSPEEVTRIVDDSSDDMMKELIRLKEETEANKVRILELSSDNERLKLKAAEEQLANLQKQRAALEPGEPKSDGVAPTQRERTSLSSGIRENSREIASIPQSETGGVNAGSQGPAAPQVPSSGGAAASLGGLNRALLATSGNIGRTDESLSPLVLSSATTRTSGLEIKSQDIGLDLMEYISSNDSDIQTLINLKSSGLLYKYKTVVNGEVVEKELLIDYRSLNEDVKKLIDQKIAQNKNRSTEVLRLDREIEQMRRVNRYSALKIILGEQMKK